MRHMILSAAAAIALVGAGAANAAEITLIAPGGIRAALMAAVEAATRRATELGEK